jgi:DNA-3-methyladenine glycosylase
MGRGGFPAYRRLGRRFFARSAEELAPDLLGCALVLRVGALTLAIKLVEVEAYLGVGKDPASHAFRGVTARNEQMFATPGHLYVYFTYGMHYCSNVVAEKKGVAGAVLLRAGEVLQGAELMGARRGRKGVEIANGPAKLCQALGLDLRHNGLDLTRDELGIWPFAAPKRVARSHRIGVREGKDLRLRFFDPQSPFVSGKRA